MKWDRLLSGVAWLIAVATVLVPGVLLIANTDTALGFDVIFVLAVPVYAITAAAILNRHPRNSVGWLLLIIGTALALSTAMTVLIPTQPTPPVPGWKVAIIAASSVSWIYFIYPLFLLFMVFPDGRLLSRRWRVLVALEVAMMAFMLFVGAFSERVGPLDANWTIANPIGFLGEDVFGPWFEILWTPALVLLSVSGVAALILRYRRGDTIKRHQLKWLLSTVAIFVVGYTISGNLPDSPSGAVSVVGFAANALFGAATLMVPLAIAVAVFRYRLFEIDRIISRTVGYVLVIGLLAVVYAAGAAWLPTRLGGESPLFVAGSTLAVAALFNPVRRRLLHWVDRKFYRTRYDAERVVDGFVASLKDRTDLNGLADEWVTAVTETMRPASIGIWVRS